MKNEVSFSFYGVNVCVKSNCEELLHRVELDFNYFKCSSVPTGSRCINIEAMLEKVANKESLIKDYKRLYSFRKIETYEKNKERINFYSDNCVSRYDFITESGRVSSDDIMALHEVCYLIISSRVGKSHDLMGIHRIHGCFLSLGDRSIIAIGASGVGKTTLAWNLLKMKFFFGGDDVCLVNKQGEFLPFPVRIGFSEEVPGYKYDMILKRREYEPKFLYDLSGKVSITNKRANSHIIFLQQGNNIKRKANALEMLKYFSLYLILGVGTPQILEYFWESGIGDFFTKSKIFISRLMISIKIMSNNKMSYLSSNTQAVALQNTLEIARRGNEE